MKRLISITIILIISLSGGIILAGCGKEKSKPEVTNPIEIFISIDYPKKAKTPDMENFKFKVEKKSNVLEATELYASMSEIPLLVGTTSNTITSINKIANNDPKYNKKATWQFKVNGKLIEGTPDSKRLHDGDSIEWIYMK